MTKISKTDEDYMRLALMEAAVAAKRGDVPIGAVIVRDGEVISTGQNNRESAGTALGHAEINAIATACKCLGGWHLDRCEMYVTLEPCAMCAGAILNAHIKRVVYGARDKKAGAMGSVISLDERISDRNCEVVGGVLEKECASALSTFFKSIRKPREDE